MGQFPTDGDKGIADVVALLNEANEIDEEVGTDFYMLNDAIPDQDITSILDQVSSTVDLNQIEGQSNSRNVGRVVGNLLVRHIDTGHDASDEQWWTWLQAYQALHGRFTGGRNKDLKDRVERDKELQQRVVRFSLDRFEVNDDKWRLIHDLRVLGQFAIEERDLRSWIIDYVEDSDPGEKRNFLYELALILNVPDNEDHGQVGVRLSRLAENDPGLHEVGERIANREPEEWELEEAERKAKWERKKAAQEQKRKEDFDRDRMSIRSGEHGGWMQWLGHVYYSQFGDVDEAVRPDERLASLLGEGSIDDCLEGLIAYSKDKGTCGLADVLELHREGQWRPIWLALVAGLDERSKQGEDVAATLPKDELAAALAIDLKYTLRRGGTKLAAGEGWQSAAFSRYPKLAYDTYWAIACSDIERGSNHIEGLTELLSDQAFADRRGETAIELLENYASLSLNDVERLLLTALEHEPVHSRLTSMTDAIVNGRMDRTHEETWRWLVAAYLVDQAKYGDLLRAEAKKHKEVIWVVRDFAGYERVNNGQKKIALPSSELSELAVLVGETFPAAKRPSSTTGSHNDWDGSEFFAKLIDEISAGVTKQETFLLEKLTGDARLASYRERLQSALANQKAQRREAEFDQPGWDATLNTIANREPANIADLHALVDEQLVVITEEIATGNADAFKWFWNEDSHARPTTPKVEESCRDVLLDMLRQKLTPLGITVEPEGHMALDKRADIAVFFGEKKIVIELKRDNHDELWTAATEQLDRFYTRDHQCSGHGVYGVFWFGERRTGSVTLNPNTKTAPSSASELKQMLEERLEEREAGKITIVVIDVSGAV